MSAALEKELPDLMKFIATLARESAAVIMPHFRSATLTVERKGDASPVTEADRGGELRMRELIAERYPTHGVVGEEFDDSNPGADLVWILDPIDGTISFTGGSPLFGTLICLAHEGRPVLGAIHLPAVGQLLVGDGRETRLNGTPVRVRTGVSLEEALLLVTDIGNIDRYRPGVRFTDLLKRVRVMRTWGDCYGYAQVAAGWADVMMDPIMNRWDLMALIPVVEGAGGRISDWSGNDAAAGDSCLAAPPALHEAVLEYLHR